MGKLNVLVVDIESSPLLIRSWGLRDQYVSNNQMVKDWFLLSWAAKWLGDSPSKMMYMDQSKKKRYDDDKDLVLAIWKLLDEADIIVTQNGERFDSRKLNARFIEYGMNPPSPYTHLDTYKILSRVAAFSSHSLDFLSNKLCTKYRKLAHKKYPGMELWNECLKGNQDAWKEMKKYNIHDVLSTEELYLKVRAWTPQTAPKVYINDTESVLRICSVCGGKTRNIGIRKDLKIWYRRLLCLKCGHWDREAVKKHA